MNRRRAFRSGLLLIAVTCLYAVIVLWARPARTETSANAFVVRNVRVFDGEKVIPKTDVAVAAGKIVAVGPNVAAPRGAQIIDGAGDTLLPGLIDSHVHIWTPDVLTSALAFGVTTELDMFMRWRDAQFWKQEEAKGAYNIADFRTAGTCSTVPGGHGTETDGPIPTIIRPEEAQAFVDARIAEGSDYIKIMYENGPRWAAMSKDTMAAIVKAAHQRGKLVVVHGSGKWRDIVAAGADGLAHVPISEPPTKELGELMKAHHMFAITTMSYTDFVFGPARLTTKLAADPLVAPYLDPLMLDSVDRPPFHSPEHLSYAYNEASLRVLHDAGVPLLAGTDASSNTPIGALLHTELELMVRAGLTPSETLADATSVPARIFSLTDRGRIAVGKRADLLLVRGDPTVDIRATRDIVAIWKQGVKFDRDAYRNAMAQRNEAWRFGSGWWPFTDGGYHGTSTVHVNVVDGGPEHARTTMILAGEVQPGISLPFAGAMHYPARWGFSPIDYSGVKDLTFWSRGDSRKYWVSIFAESHGNGLVPAPVGFVANRDWEKHTIPLSAFGTDGHDIGSVFVGSAAPGKFELQLSGFRFGTGAWTGMTVFFRQPSPAGAKLPLSPEAVINQIVPGSPADIAEIQVNDVVKTFHGEPIKKPYQLRNLALQISPGSTVPIEIVRDGKEQTLQVRPSEPP
ncbi:MAG: amidohydrolase family protein [Candidatus Binataceae bacterium]